MYETFAVRFGWEHVNCFSIISKLIAAVGKHYLGILSHAIYMQFMRPMPISQRFSFACRVIKCCSYANSNFIYGEVIQIKYQPNVMLVHGYTVLI